MIESPATRAVENTRPWVLVAGSFSAALAGDSIALCLLIIAMTTVMAIRLFSLTH